MTAYYNEFDKKAAAWLRQLIADGHIPPGDVDERSILDVTPDDLAGGTFTLSNPGSVGAVSAPAIINQPQVAILSTDAVKRKPVVIEDSFGNESIAIHSVGILAMAWDHRAIDGAYAAAFLARTKEILETRDWESELA